MPQSHHLLSFHSPSGQASPSQIPSLFTLNRTKNHLFEATPPPVLHKNSLFKAKKESKLQKKSRSSPCFHRSNSPNYPVCKPLSPLFSGKNPKKTRIMVNFPVANLPHPIWPWQESPARTGRLHTNFPCPILLSAPETARQCSPSLPPTVGIGQNRLARTIPQSPLKSLAPARIQEPQNPRTQEPSPAS